MAHLTLHLPETISQFRPVGCLVHQPTRSFVCLSSQTGIEKVSDHAKSPWKLGPHRLLQVGAISREEYEADRSESSWKTGDE